VLGFPAEADVVVEIKGVEPRLDIFASLAALPDVFGKTGESFGIAVGAPLFHIQGPCFDFPQSTRGLGVGVDPFQDFAVTFSFGQLLQEGF
jgi:hypothetical protein